MNDLVKKDTTVIEISDSTKELIRAGVSENTLRAYGWALQKLDEWLSAALSPRELDRCTTCRVHHPSIRIRQIARNNRTSRGCRQMAIEQLE